MTCAGRVSRRSLSGRPNAGTRTGENATAGESAHGPAGPDLAVVGAARVGEGYPGGVEVPPSAPRAQWFADKAHPVV